MENLELIKVEEKNLSIMFVSDKGLDPVLDAVEKQVDSFVPDISNEKGRAEVKSFAYKIARSKTALDDIGKGLVAEQKAKIKVVDTERKRVRDKLDSLKERVRKPLTDWENKEKERINKHENGINELEDLGKVIGDTGLAFNLEELKTSLRVLESITMGPIWEEFELKAMRVKDKSLITLRARINELEEAERQRQENERFLKEKEERERQEREERLKKEAAEKAKLEAEEKARKEKEEAERKAREEKEKIEKEKIEAEERERRQKEEKEKAEREAKELKVKLEREKIEAAKREKEAKERAEREAKEREEKAIKQEQERIAAEKRKEEEEKKRREADKAHKKSVNDQAAHFMVENTSFLTQEQALELINIIAAGKIPNINIEY